MALPHPPGAPHTSLGRRTPSPIWEPLSWNVIVFCLRSCKSGAQGCEEAVSFPPHVPIEDSALHLDEDQRQSSPIEAALFLTWNWSELNGSAKHQCHSFIRWIMQLLQRSHKFQFIRVCCGSHYMLINSNTYAHVIQWILVTLYLVFYSSSDETSSWCD
jgi:hypothetical protein